jgi:hypothetical protein
MFSKEVVSCWLMSSIWFSLIWFFVIIVWNNSFSEL